MRIHIIFLMIMVSAASADISLQDAAANNTNASVNLSVNQSINQTQDTTTTKFNASNASYKIPFTNISISNITAKLKAPLYNLTKPAASPPGNRTRFKFWFLVAFAGIAIILATFIGKPGGLRKFNPAFLYFLGTSIAVIGILHSNDLYISWLLKQENRKYVRRLFGLLVFASGSIGLLGAATGRGFARKYNTWFLGTAAGAVMLAGVWLAK